MYLKGRPITMYMNKDQMDSYCLEARAELPSNKLKLDWVYPFAFELIIVIIEHLHAFALLVSLFLQHQTLNLKKETK